MFWQSPYQILVFVKKKKKVIYYNAHVMVVLSKRYESITKLNQLFFYSFNSIPLLFSNTFSLLAIQTSPIPVAHYLLWNLGQIGDFISFSRISSSTSRFPKRKQGYEHFLEFPFLSHRFFQEQFSATVLCNHHLYLAPKHFHLSPNNLFLIPSF